MTTEIVEQVRAEEVERRQAEVRELASTIWDGALVAADRHPYAALWGESAARLKVYRGELTIGGVRCDGSLVMPARDAEGSVWNVGFITSLSTVRFLPGGRIAHTYFGWGLDRSTIVVSRGFAKAVEIHAATGHAVAVAFTPENIENVMGIMADRHPKARVVLATDLLFASLSKAEPQNPAAPTALRALLASDSDGTAANDSQTIAASQAVAMSLGRLAADMDRGLLTAHPDAKRLLDWIERKRLAVVTRSRILTLGPTRLRSAEVAKSALLTLVERGWLTTEDGIHYRVLTAAAGPSKDLAALTPHVGAAEPAPANDAS
jgi:hypothetical protein